MSKVNKNNNCSSSLLSSSKQSLSPNNFSHRIDIAKYDDSNRQATIVIHANSKDSYDTTMNVDRQRKKSAKETSSDDIEVEVGSGKKLREVDQFISNYSDNYYIEDGREYRDCRYDCFDDSGRSHTSKKHRNNSSSR